MKKFGQVIVDLRKQKGLTQKQLGDALNVSYQAVSKWEHDLSYPDVETIQKLAEVFDISVADFFDLIDNKGSIEGVQKSNINESKPKISFNQKLIFAMSGLAVVILSLILIVCLVSVNLTSGQIYNRVDPAVFCITTQNSGFQKSGSGFFIDSHGTAVTNYHVIENCSRGKVQLNDGKIYDIIKVVGCDENRDIAIIKVDIDNNKYVTLANSDKVSVGDVVYAIGYPESFTLGSSESTLTAGIISKASYSIEGLSYIQTTADITRGNSGGVLINERGQIIGITTGAISIGSVNYMNLAIPINALKNVEREYDMTLEEYANYHFVFKCYDDGRIYKRIEIKRGDKINPPAITKTGYTFEGWFEEETFDNIFDFTQPIVNKECCYAKWSPNTYLIRFDANGGNGTMTDISATYDQNVTLSLNNFEKIHYVFKGWEQDNAGSVFTDGQTVKNLTSTDKAIVVLKAIWEECGYKISFDGNDAMGTMPTLTLKYSETANLPQNDFVKDGYIFSHWEYDGQQYQDCQEVSQLCETDEILTFVAQWNPITYTIQFDSNNGTQQTTSQLLTYDQPSQLNECIFENTKEDKVFGYWECFENGVYIGKFNNGEQVVNLTTHNNAVLTFKAIWRNFYYIIDFDLDGGNGETKLVEAEYGEYLTLKYYISSPTKTGYEFNGWSYGGDVYSHNSSIKLEYEKDAKPIKLTFKARWFANSYKVIYYLNEESFKDNKDPEYTQNFVYDTPQKLIKNPFENPGAEFDYWKQIKKASYQGGWTITYGEKKFTDEEEVLNLTTSEGTTLVAFWKGVKFKIAYHNFDGNDGVRTIDREYSLSSGANSLTNSTIWGCDNVYGKVFKGWIFNDKLYKPNERIYFIADLNVKSGETYHLYAQWEDAPTCEIQFYANGGDGEMETVTVFTNEDYYLPKCTFTREGYRFRCWSIDREWQDSTEFQDFNQYKEGEEISCYNYIKPNVTIVVWANWGKIEEAV